MMSTNIFSINIIPTDDDKRLAALHRYEILDTPPEGAFDKIATLAQSIFSVPIALVAMVDKEQVFFKANVGMGNTRTVDRGVSLCSLAVLQDGATVFENASEDPCLLQNPLVAGSFGLRFYAGAPITTKDGHRIGTVCIVDRKPREFTQEQQSILEQLAALVMNELELRLATRKALGTQTEMLNVAIHDLKSPINNISGLANLIEMEANQPEKVLAYTSLIKQVSGSMNEVAHNLMEATLRTTGEHSLKLEVVDLSELLEYTIEEHQAYAIKKEQQLEAEVKKNIKVQGDPVKLKIVFDNLISNAMKYSPLGSTIDINLKKSAGAAVLEVKDEGQGLSEEDKEKLFQKYTRLSAKPTNRESSTGLGLYITKKIVEQHQGKIRAESEGKNQGSRFIVELPA